MCALPLAGVAPGLFGQPAAQRPQLIRRLVVVLRDQTPSFKNNLAEANQAIGRLVGNMGPLDRLIVVEIASGFHPLKQVHETPFPEVSPAVFHSANAQEFGRVKRELEEAWAEAERIRKRLGHEIAQPVSIDVAYTDIYTPLEYVSERMGTFDGEKYLVILSDLVTDMKGGLKTEGPPKKYMKFPGVKVTALFVPWKPGGKNDSKMKAWVKWFEAGGATFEMHDEVASPGIAVLAKSSVPKRPGNPLKEAAAKR